MICGLFEFVSWFDSTLWSDIKVEDVNSRSVDRTLDIEEKDELVVSDDDRSNWSDALRTSRSNKNKSTPHYIFHTNKCSNDLWNL